MPTTPDYALRYPAYTDAPDVPLAIEHLADDLEGWLSRAWPCTSTTRPASPPEGLIIRESDTGAVLIADALGVWSPLGGSSAGTITDGHAQYSASTNQVIDNDRWTAVQFGAVDTPTPQVTRAAFRPVSTEPFGHMFVLGAAGIWAISATVSYAASSKDGQRYAGIHVAAVGVGEPLAASGQRIELEDDGATSLHCSVTRYFPAGSQIYVPTYQSSTGDRYLDRGTNGGWVRINLALVRA